MGMRLSEGIDTEHWAKVTGRTLDREGEADLSKHGLVERTGDRRLRATPAGMLLLDSIIAALAA